MTYSPTRSPFIRTILAGMPTTVALSGTSFSTTEFAPILAFSPIRMFPSTFAPAAIVTPFFTALAALFARAAQSYLMIDQYIVAHLSRLADNYAHAVIDKKPSADLGARMYLDAR